MHAGRELRSWLTFGALLIAAGALALLLGVGAVRAGLATGPPLELRLGEYYLLARTTEHPACLPLPAQCFIPRPSFAIPQPRYYSVWAGRLLHRRPGRFVEANGQLVLQLPVGAP